MFSTKPLLRNSSRLHQWVHHPDPLTAEQTKRFLDTVTTSFRKNLDREHSPIVEYEKSLNTPLTESNNRHSTTTDARDNVAADRPHLPTAGSPFRPTDHHLLSILSNPLFQRTQTSPLEPGAKRDPMDVFDVAVSKGLMTVDIAKGCMIAKYRIISRPQGRLITDIPAINEGLSKSGVCDRVLGWLQSSGMSRTLEFASYRPFVRALMPFLLAEGKENLAWDWIWRLLSGNEAHNREGDAKFLLYLLIISKTVRHQPVDNALETIIQASDTFRWYPHYVNLLRGAWVSLSDRTTAIASLAPPASASLFNTYLGLADHLRPRSLKLPIAHLHLHHPTTPTYDRALEYFEQMESEKSRSPTLAKNTVVNQQREAMMGFDTINSLSQIGRFEEADSLMAFIKSRYSTYASWFPDPTLSYLENT